MMFPNPTRVEQTQLQSKGAISKVSCEVSGKFLKAEITVNISKGQSDSLTQGQHDDEKLGQSRKTNMTEDEKKEVTKGKCWSRGARTSNRASAKSLRCG